MTTLTPDLALVVAERFRVLGEPMRLRLLDALRRGERTVGDLMEAVETGQANCSRHLQLLHAHGFVARRREGTRVLYRIADPAVFDLCDLMCGRLEATAEHRRSTLRSARRARA